MLLSWGEMSHGSQYQVNTSTSAYLVTRPQALPTISVKPQYKAKIATLIDVTVEHVKKHIGGIAATVTTMAQRVDPAGKINESIK